MHKVLFISSSNTHFAYLSGLAISLKSRGDFKCIFFIDPFVPGAADVKKKCLAEGFYYYEGAMIASATRARKIVINRGQERGVTSRFFGG